MSEHVLSMRGVSTPQSQVQRASKSARWKRPESWEYRLLYGVTFIVFLGAACIETLNPRRLVRKDGAEQQTIIQRASLGARTCVAYAFMG